MSATQTAPMSLDLVIGLVALESEFVTADGILRALLGRLVMNPLPEAREALGIVGEARARLRVALAKLDGPIDLAVRQHDSDFPPPF